MTRKPSFIPNKSLQQNTLTSIKNQLGNMRLLRRRRAIKNINYIKIHNINFFLDINNIKSLCKTPTL